jgi:hypothetical protein
MPALRYLSVALLSVAFAFSPLIAAAERLAIWRADGTRETDSSLAAWPLPETVFSQAGNDQGSALPRLVCGRPMVISRRAPYLVMANGDVLPGTPLDVQPSTHGGQSSPLVRVHLESPLAPASGSGLFVRTERVQRLVLSGDGLTPQEPGTAIFADGRRVIARAIRWRQGGLALLTQNVVIEAAFGELADVTFPAVDSPAAVLEDSLLAGGAGNAGPGTTAIARWQTDGGAVLTASRVSRSSPASDSRRRREDEEEIEYTLQPAWSQQPLLVPDSRIACCGYRQADEAPLSLFPAETLVNRRLIGQPAPWQANAQPGGGLLAATNLQSDLGIAAHAESTIAIDLPEAARSLSLWVGLDRAVGSGGCVRCKIMAERGTSQSRPLWESGILTGRDGARPTGLIDVRGLERVLLVTEFAHEERPAGADPFDICDAVVWLSPMVKLDPSAISTPRRALAMLPGASDWELSGDAWQTAELASRWDASAGVWNSALSIGQAREVKLVRRLTVTRACDVVELLTICPANLEDHDFSLRVNGVDVPWHNNADRNELRQWTLRYSRSRSRQGDVETNLTDRLAYWWDLAPWRGQEVALELTLRGRRPTGEILWRSLAVCPAIGNLPSSGEPHSPDVPLTALAPLGGEGRDTVRVLKNAVPRGKGGEPIRFLGQKFAEGYGLARDSSLRFSIQPEYRRFVAVVGCTYQVAGPVQVLIDGHVVWERAAISSLAPAEQIDIAIPPGAKTLTLQCGADSLYYGYAAFAEAGFVSAR